VPPLMCSRHGPGAAGHSLPSMHAFLSVCPYYLIIIISIIIVIIEIIIIM